MLMKHSFISQCHQGNVVPYRPWINAQSKEMNEQDRGGCLWILLRGLEQRFYNNLTKVVW